ncbi:MAG: chromate efflux transporter [Alphaproteobacteria bacterium]|nr:chromate efflux transporter [Alphaproteobacteria bacterium]
MPDASSPSRDPAAPSFAEALRFWFKLGCINFGGPAGQIAIMQHELVDRKRWIDQGAFLRGLTFANLLPGPEAQQLATYIGWRLHGTWGGIAAGGLFIIPGAIVLFALSWVAAAHGSLPFVAAIFDGLKPVIIAVIAQAVWRVGSRTLHSWPAVALAVAAFIAIFVAGIDFPWIVLAAAAIGWLWPGPVSPFAQGNHGAAAANDVAHAAAHRSPFRVAALIGVFVALWAAAVFGTIALAGRAPYADIATLFTKAAFVTFGGAYAVLPYVAEAAVNDYGWLTPADMLNGLALAETTPGPLILVLQYVGFFAGWNAPGALPPLAAATIAAALTSYVTFLPSFLFILLGAPYVEGLHANKRVAAALGAVTAAVVGVILNLGVFLAQGVLFQGGRVAWAGVALAAASFVALQHLKIAIHWLVLAGALIGLAQRFLLS